MVDYKLILRKMINLCWICLFICFTIKIFGGNWFEIYTTNERFIAVCEFIESHNVTKLAYSFIISSLSIIPMWLIIIKRKWFEKQKHFYIGLALIFINCIFKILGYTYVGVTIDLFQAFVYSFYLSNYNLKTFLKAGIVLITLTFFQYISFTTKNLVFQVMTHTNINIVSATIFSVDYYIMILLYYLYMLKGGVFNGNNRVVIYVRRNSTIRSIQRYFDKRKRNC